ncbi:thiopurine S-methyltransferase [Methylophilus sp. TWE2]|uniref:thiopurine S-methyltransferase n=1 Tax=Methylophilus sp. TWE2 TaxID=1662285 RepID=UPI000670C656|nr:thiopurine S-methyltransferase [Methylophilus sp. TWE2]AKR42180.1 thiopurine S-methyltransferase [Methylophilus sp. TWE2]
MQHDFWHQRWQNQQIGFHQGDINPFLLAHLQALGLQAGQRVFVPLCGKSLDMHWLLAQGYQVVGAELSQLAVDAFFTELKLAPEITQSGSLRHYRTEQIEILQGDFFALTQDQLGTVDAIYDRAALIALPDEMRKQYSRHLMSITQTAPQLLISFQYDQSLVPGPPFSVSRTEVSAHYEPHYVLTERASTYQEKGMKGQYPAEETAWLLRPR